MKFLICIGGVEPSADTIRFGGRIAKAFQADVSILSVQPRTPTAVRQEIRLAREKMLEWEIEIPAVRALRAARDILQEEGLINTSGSGEIVQKHPFKAGVRGAYELHIMGVHDQNIRFRLREGDIIGEVNKEIESDQLDLVISGASQQRRLLPKLVQFVNCTMLVVKNPRDVKYELLICTDSSAASRKAEQFGSNLAHALNLSVMLLSVAKSKNREHVAMEGAERASKLLSKAGVRHSISVRMGNVVDEISYLAREDTVVVMGASRMSEIRKLLFGSKPTRVIERVHCPVLIVK